MKKRRRVTKLVRVGAKMHSKLKVEAREEGMTISRILDKIIQGYLKSSTIKKS